MSNITSSPETLGRRESRTDVFSRTLLFNTISIQVNSTNPFSDGVFESLKDSVTGMEIGTDQQPADGTIDYVIADDIDIDYATNQRKLTLVGPRRLFGNGSSIAFIAHYMAECLRADTSGVMLVHAAAVKLPDEQQSYVLLGEKGAGKTTLALRLCHQYGYGLIGNDQIFVGSNNTNELVTDSGNTWFNVRETALAADPYIARILGKPDNVDKPSWNNKIVVKPESIGVTSHAGQLPVQEIFHVRIDHSQPDLRAVAWQGLQRNLVLHEKIGRHVTGQATPFQDDDGNYLGSLPPVNLAAALKARDKLVNLVIRTGVTEIFSPDSDSAVEYINSRRHA